MSAPMAAPGANAASGTYANNATASTRQPSIQRKKSPPQPLYYSSQGSRDNSEDEDDPNVITTADQRRISLSSLFPTLPASPGYKRRSGDSARSHGKTLSGSLPSGVSQEMKRPNTSPMPNSGRTSSWMKDEEAMSIRSTSSASSSRSDTSSASISVTKPARPSKTPFIPAEAPTGCFITVDDSSPSHYKVAAKLPGFLYEHITVALKRNGSLHILADRWGEESPKASPAERQSGHFERMVILGQDAVGGQARAAWSGEELTVTVTRKVLKEQKESGA